MSGGLLPCDDLLGARNCSSLQYVQALRVYVVLVLLSDLKLSTKH